MQFKLITAIIVLLLLVASLSVAGCTSSSSSSIVSTDYPTSGRSKLVEAAVEQIRKDVEGATSSDYKLQSFTVNWTSDTRAETQELRLDTKTFDVYEYTIDITHFPTTDAATAYYKSHEYFTFKGTGWSSPPIDYYKLTGKAPKVYNEARDSWGNNGILQYDNLVVEKWRGVISPAKA